MAPDRTDRDSFKRLAEPTNVYSAEAVLRGDKLRNA